MAQRRLGVSGLKLAATRRYRHRNLDWDDEIDTLIKEADEDGDGHIDYEEFSKILLNKDAGDHERVQVTKVKRKIATHAKKDVRLGASADESKDSAH